MIDLLRVSLIILLSLSVLIIPILYALEGLFYGFTFGGLFTRFILCITQITLIIVLCVTKKVKTLLIFLIINIVIILILFILEIISLYNFVENTRQKFYDLIEKYPDGKIPDNWNLIPAYIAVKDKKCCGIDNRNILPINSTNYFYRNFLKNCLVFSMPILTKPNYEYHGQPCMNVVRDSHHMIIIISVVKMVVIIFMLVLFAIYIVLRRREQNRMIQPILGITNDQRMIYPSSTSLNYPSNTFINNPNVLNPPMYPNISQL